MEKHYDIDFDRDIKIDEENLEAEWLRQPELALKYSRHWAECKARLTHAEERLKITRSELIAQAYADPDYYLGEGIKSTQQTVEAYYRNDKKHKQLKKEWEEALKECNMAEVAKWEITKTRKAALENLVTLFTSEYFAGPKIPHNIAEARRNLQDKVDDGVARKLNRRTTFKRKK